MTAFWTRFLQQPDSIRTTARRQYLRPVALRLGQERPLVRMVDMPALAARSPAVAVDLQMVGLTAQQHEAYRIALADATVVLTVERHVAAAAKKTAILLTNATKNRWSGVSPSIRDGGGIRAWPV